MKSPEIGVPTDYKAIGAKLSSGENLSNDDKGIVYSTCLEYTKNLIDLKAGSLRGFEQKDQEVKDYLKFVVLGRISHLHQEAIKNNQTEAESVVVFNNLKDHVCGRFLIESESLSDKTLSDFVDNAVFERIGKGPDQKISDADMKFVREAGAIVVGPNTSVLSEGIRHVLD